MRGLTGTTHAGADVNIINQYGRTPLHYAAVAKVKAVRICKMLLKAGADIQARMLAQHAPVTAGGGRMLARACRPVAFEITSGRRCRSPMRTACGRSS